MTPPSMGATGKPDLGISFWLINGDTEVPIQLLSDNDYSQYCINTYATLNKVTLSIDPFTLAPT